MNAFGFENSVLIKYWCLKPYFYSFKFYFMVKFMRNGEIHEKIGGYFAIP
ncbi:hypothetical protein HPNQ4053_1634 [Helicobacter pylori NQ4053]|uniref:Uncharacterized protein n=1 Tax=Helicobacter pylori NQ4053 TaxID=992027 RepID=I9QIM7_HELPX|nr:hypothetical protein HPNQ4053_1634 [Helicobacter pylori NQ4053]